MTTTAQRTDLLARRYLAAYAAKDLDTIAGMFADAIHLQDWNLQAHGKAAALRETRANFEAVESLVITVRQVFATATQAAAQLHILIDGQAELEVVDVLSFDDDGRITAIRAYKG